MNEMVKYIVDTYRNNGVKINDPVEVKVRHLKSDHNTPQACFENAFHIVNTHKDATYVLGFIIVHGCPIEHAWVKLPDDDYVDSTLNSEDYQYFKVLELDRLEMIKVVLARNLYPSLHDVLRYRRKRRKT